MSNALNTLPEALGKHLVATAGLAFGLGLVVENLYLSSHGVVGAALLRTEYVLAGILCGFLTLLPALIFDGIVTIWRRLRHYVGKRQYYFALLSTVPLLATVLVVPAFFLERLSDNRIRRGDIAFYITIVVLSSMSVFAYLVVEEIQDASGVDRLVDLFARGHLYQFAWKVLFLLGAITTYAAYVYPQLEAPFGGGFRRPSFLVLAADTPPAIKRMLVPHRSDPSVVGPVQIIHESDHEVFILARPWRESDHAIVISREFVKADIPQYP